MEQSIKNNLALETKDIQEIHQELVIGGGNCDLYLEAYVDDELVVNKKSDSLLGNFLKILQLQMGGYNYQASGMPAISVANTQGNQTVNASYNISAIAVGADNVCRITLPSSYIPTTPTTGYASIQGTQSSSTIGLVDGLYAYTYVNSTTIDLIGTTYVTGDSAKYTANSASARLIVNITAPARYPSGLSFGTSYIVVGTGETTVSLADNCLKKEIQSAATAGRLTYNTGTISLDTADSTSSQITFTRTFTNNSTGSITVNEMGMYVNYGPAGTTNPFVPYQVLIMRDLSTVAVGVGKVLTISYKIKSTLATGTNAGGFLQIYTKLLYRMFAQTTRPAIDINNISRSYGQSLSTFKVVNTGGEINGVTYGGSAAVVTDPAWKQGIVIGTGTTATSVTDYYVETVIAHGSGSGQMIYYGGLVQNYVIDAAYHSFDIVKIIENQSGDTITVNEIALIVGGDNGSSDSASLEFPLHFFTIARNVLTTGVDVTTNKMLKITYTIKVVL